MKTLAKLLGLIITGLLLTGIWSLLSGKMTTTKNVEQLAGVSLTQTAMPAQPTIQSNAWQPVSLDLAKAAEYGLTITEREWKPNTYYGIDSPTSFSISLQRFVNLEANPECWSNGEFVCSPDSNYYIPNGFDCYARLSYPQDPERLWEQLYQKNGQENTEIGLLELMLSQGFINNTSLSARVWDISGPEGNIREYFQYTVYMEKNNPLCRDFRDEIQFRKKILQSDGTYYDVYETPSPILDFLVNGTPTP